MKNKLKSIGIFLLVLFFTVIAIGCSDKGADGSSKGKGTKDKEPIELPEPGDFSEKITVHLSGSFSQGKVKDNNWVQKKLEEMFNVEIVNSKINTWNGDEWSIAVASGDLPDTFAPTSGTLTNLEYYDGGLTRTIPKEMIQKYAPLYSEMLDENPPGWDLGLAPDKDDEYLNLTGLHSHTSGILWAPTFRLDWLEKLGIDPPGEIEPIGDEGGLERIYFTDAAYTLEEVEEILRAFTFDDPNGTGKDDTYGMLPYNNQLHWMTTIMGAHGVAAGYNLEEDGELKAAEISNKYKEGLKLLAKWNDQGLIDPEWVTLDAEKAWEKYKLGRTGYFTAQRSYVALEDWTLLRAPQNLVLSDPDVKLLVTAPEIGPNGQQGQGSWTAVTLLADAFYVNANVDDAKLARILQIFDYINHDEDARWTIYGEVGTHSEWQGTPEESAIIVTEDPPEEGDMGFRAYNFRTYPGKYLQWLTSEYTFKLMDKFFARPDVVEKMAIRPHRHDLFNETKARELNDRYSGQLNTIVEEFRMKAIVGEIDIDKEWDKYVESYLDNGGREILEELAKAPKVSDLLSQ